MAGRNMLLDVIVRMRDLMSGPLSRLRAGIQSIANLAKKIGAVGSAIAAISFFGPINEAAAFQQKLLDIAATQNLAGRAAFDYVSKAKAQFEGLAFDVGQLSENISNAAGQMVAAGVDQRLVDASIGTVGRAATAANAEISDMAAVATSLMTTLKVPASQLEDSLGALVVAGKLGAFELKDMSRFFPTLTGQMAKFGVTGREAVNFLASALQIARKGTSNPEEAANNLKNFLSKILAPETIKKFADMGVDIEAVMKNAAVKGINPIEAVVQKIVKLTGISGKEIEGLMKKAKAAGMTDVEALAQVRAQLEKTYGAGRLGELFGDMQVLDFLIPMLGNIDEYKRVKEEVAKATGAAIDPDFETQMEGLNRQLITFREIVSQAVREAGLAFGTWLPVINENLIATLKWLRETDQETGGLVRQMLAFAGAAVALAGALGALGFVLPAITAGFAAMMMPVTWLVRGAIALGAVLAGPIMAGLSAIGAALAAISAPVWLLIAAVAALAAAVYIYWDEIKAAFTAAVPIITEHIQMLIGKVQAVQAAIREFVTGMAQAGLDAGAQFAASVMAKIDELIAWFKSIPGRIMDAIGSIDIGGLIKWPSMPGWLGGGGGDGSAPAAAGNDNRLPAQAGGGGKTDVSGSIGITVTGPGTVTSAESSNPSVPLKANTGRVVGRN